MNMFYKMVYPLVNSLKVKLFVKNILPPIIYYKLKAIYHGKTVDECISDVQNNTVEIINTLEINDVKNCLNSVDAVPIECLKIMVEIMDCKDIYTEDFNENCNRHATDAI